MGAACYDCGLPYSSPAWADVVVPDDIWLKISPTGHDGGLLCFNCMNGRLAAIDAVNVPFMVASGPFSFAVRRGDMNQDF